MESNVVRSRREVTFRLLMSHVVWLQLERLGRWLESQRGICSGRLRSAYRQWQLWEVVTTYQARQQALGVFGPMSIEGILDDAAVFDDVSGERASGLLESLAPFEEFSIREMVDDGMGVARDYLNILQSLFRLQVLYRIRVVTDFVQAYEDDVQGQSEEGADVYVVPECLHGRTMDGAEMPMVAVRAAMEGDLEDELLVAVARYVAGVDREQFLSADLVIELFAMIDVSTYVQGPAVQLCRGCGWACDADTFRIHPGCRQHYICPRCFDISNPRRCRVCCMSRVGLLNRHCPLCLEELSSDANGVFRLWCGHGVCSNCGPGLVDHTCRCPFCGNRFSLFVRAPLDVFGDPVSRSSLAFDVQMDGAVIDESIYVSIFMPFILDVLHVHHPGVESLRLDVGEQLWDEGVMAYQMDFARRSSSFDDVCWPP